MHTVTFRDLRADEIECRVAMVKSTGCSLLLYKDARCDMNILDETLGITGWKRHHDLINGNLFCTVEIYDPEKGEWISKQDVGTESYTDKEKGQASDSFKRACFNLGIGRELYTAPFIWINAGNVSLTKRGDKYTTYDNFVVSKISIENKKITALEIINEKSHTVVFKTGFVAEQNEPKESDTYEDTEIDEIKIDLIRKKAKEKRVPLSQIYSYFEIQSLADMKVSQFKICMDMLEKTVAK